MGKLRRVMRCYRCGAVLQCKSKNEKGFINKDLLEAEDAARDVLYCNHCYDKMKAINTGMLNQDIDDQILKILDDAVATDALIIWVVDLFTFNGTLNSDVVKKLKKNKFAIVGTKRDFFPAKMNDDNLKEYLRERFEEVGMKPCGIFLFGNEENIVDGQKYIQELNKARQGHDVYVVGTTACGKTSIIYKLLKFYENKSKKVIRTVTYPGTSVKVMEIPLTNSASCYEVPGFSLNTSVEGKLEKDVLKIIAPHKKIEAHSRSLLEGEAIAVGNIAAFELQKGKPTQVKFYLSEACEYKKLLTKNLENFLVDNSRKRSVRPVSDRITSFTDYDLFEYQMENDGKIHDIAVSGLGWFSFVAKGQIIRILLPKGVAVKECLGKIR